MQMKEKKRSTKTSKKSIPDEVKNQVDEIVKRFNQQEIKDPGCYHVTRYRGNYLYLDQKLRNRGKPQK
jgi:hypothetical protein